MALSYPDGFYWVRLFTDVTWDIRYFQNGQAYLNRPLSNASEEEQQMQDNAPFFRGPVTQYSPATWEVKPATP